MWVWERRVEVEAVGWFFLIYFFKSNVRWNHCPVDLTWRDSVTWNLWLQFDISTSVPCLSHVCGRRLGICHSCCASTSLAENRGMQSQRSHCTAVTTHTDTGLDEVRVWRSIGRILTLKLTLASHSSLGFVCPLLIVSYYSFYFPYIVCELRHPERMLRRGQTRSAARCHPCDFKTGLPQKARGDGGWRAHAGREWVNVCSHLVPSE